MGKAAMEKEFDIKFAKLSESNQKYVIAIQQALLYAQTIEKENKEQWRRKLCLTGMEDGI